MERRELFGRLLSGVALAAVPVKLFGNRTSVPEKQSPSESLDILNEAHFAWDEWDLGKAAMLFRQALDQLPETASSEDRADILQSYRSVADYLNHEKEAVERMQLVVARHPNRTDDTVYCLAKALQWCSQNEEAIADYHKALSANAKHNSDCYLGIGICHHREERYTEALNWLAKVPKTDGGGPEIDEDYWKALEYRLLIYSRFKMVPEAKAGVIEYIQHDRLSGRPAQAVAGIGIDSDRIYIEHAASKIA